MAAVDPFTMYSVVAGFIMFIILIVSLVNKFSSSKTENPEVAVRAPSAIPRAAEGPPGVRRRGPRRRMRMRGGDDESDEEEEKESDGEEDLDVVLQAEGKIGAKKMRKLQEKAEKRAMREQMEQEREERKKREKEADERRKKEEELQKQEEAARAEEERKRKEEQERREHEEYLKLKEAFTVDEEGQQDMEADLDSHSLLQEFMTYIRETKVVILEDLAAHFKLNTQDVIQRVQDLQTSGDLTGVIDDRGKFIYITVEELEAVAKFIRQNGRVSIAELAESSNRLITLDPDLRRLQSASGTLSPDTLVA